MIQTRITPEIESFPQQFHELIRNTEIYDSSCSPNATVFFLNTDGGLYLKRAAKDELKTEADLTAYFHAHKLAAEVLAYCTVDENDWLLTRAVPGNDCTHADILAQPKRLCDCIAENLRALHELTYMDCPVKDLVTPYLATAEQNYRSGLFDPSYCPQEFPIQTADESWQIVTSNRHLLKNDTLLHGDYCLPNIILHNWKLSGIIDLGHAGIGDRHMDLFWGAWTLKRNLGTEEYRSRFFDAYGRDRIDFDALRVVTAVETLI